VAKKELYDIDTWGSIHNTQFSLQLQMSPISWSVCPFHSFPVLCNETH
jgi:hypothetical protein